MRTVPVTSDFCHGRERNPDGWSASLQRGFGKTKHGFTEKVSECALIRCVATALCRSRDPTLKSQFVADGAPNFVQFNPKRAATPMLLFVATSAEANFATPSTLYPRFPKVQRKGMGWPSIPNAGEWWFQFPLPHASQKSFQGGSMKGEKFIPSPKTPMLFFNPSNIW